MAGSWLGSVRCRTRGGHDALSALRASFGWVLCGIACAALGVFFLIAVDSERVLLAPTGIAHRYSPYDPPWTQLVFPLLGTPLAPPTSPSAVLTRAIDFMPLVPPQIALPAIAAIAQGGALGLLAVLLGRLGLTPLVAAIACLVLGLHPTFFRWATAWSPYLATPALLLGMLVARLRWIETRRALWFVVVAALAACLVAETLYAIVLLVPSLYALGGPSDGGLSAWKRRAWLTSAAAAGLALHVIGAATMWREAVFAATDHLPSWWEAFVAATTRWGRLAEIYVVAPAPAEISGAMSRMMAHVQLLPAILAIIGMLWMIRTRRADALVLVGTAAAVAVIGIRFVPPVAGVFPTDVLSPTVMVMFTAVGLARVASVTGAPAVGVVFLGAVLIVQSVAAQRLSHMSEKSRERNLVDLVPAARRGVLVAGDVESDREVERVRGRLRESAGIARIAQTAAAIREAAVSGRDVYVRRADRSRVAAIGWMLLPIAVDGESAEADAVIYRVLEAMPCVGLSPGAWVNVSAPAVAGAISFYAERGSSFIIELQLDDSVAKRVIAVDVLSDQALHFTYEAGQPLRINVDRPRRSLPLAQFAMTPAIARARIVSDDASQSVRACGAPVAAQAVWFGRDDDSFTLPLHVDAFFQSGWHGAEQGSQREWMRWSSSTEAAIHVHLPGESVEIEIDAAPAVPRPTVLTFDVNGRTVGSSPMVRGRRTYAWTIDSTRLRRGLNVFVLKVPETVSPKALGGSEDTRPLGLSLSRFRLRRLEAHRAP